MKYNKTNIIGDAGEHLMASRVIKLFGFPCRLTNIDIGIDAEIEIIDENYKSTGKFIKCQVKTTTSKKFNLYIDEKHISYWNKLNIPVIIILVHIDSEKIYWHCVDDVTKYEKGKSGYKIKFKESDELKKSNKSNFLEISTFKLKSKVESILDEAYKIVLTDNIIIKSGEYDLTTFEEFVYNSNKINYDLNKVNKIIRNNDNLEIIKERFSEQIEVIHEYLRLVEEEKKEILIDHGYNYFDHLDSNNNDWD